MMTARVISAPVVVFLGVLESSSISLNPPGVQVGEGVESVPYSAPEVVGTGKELDLLGLRVKGEDNEVAWGTTRLASVGLTREAQLSSERRGVWNALNKVRKHTLIFSLRSVANDGRN